MKLTTIEHKIRSLLGSAVDIAGEYGLRPHGCTEVRRIGYATNLSLETVQGAIDQTVDLLITHHDAWDFVYGMREVCSAALSSRRIAHLFAHLPLDSAPFGTAGSLIFGIGGSVGGDLAVEEGHPCGRIGVFENPVPVSTVASRMSQFCGEEIKTWAVGKPAVSSFGVVTGGGSLTDYAHEALKKGCDLYITGEQSLYLVQYCLMAGLNLMVGSHTFTELPGVRSLALKVKEFAPEMEVVEIVENHSESAPDKAVQWTQLRGAGDL